MWKVFDDSFDNAELIFPTKQRAVGKMVEVCRKDSNVKRVIVFGSAVTSACNPWSDIDIFFDLERDVSVFPSTHDKTVYDKWNNFNASDELLKEILENGVVVYDRIGE